MANYRQIHRKHNPVHHRNSNCSCKKKKRELQISSSEGDTNANEDAKDVKVNKNAPKWRKNADQNRNIEVNYDSQGNMQ